jgi:hypothetical protein
MLFRKKPNAYYGMSALIVALLVVTAAAGVVSRGTIYAPFLSSTLVAFQFFQDLLSLFVAAGIALAMYLAHRGSTRAFAIWTGLLLYVLYYYAFYALDPAYTIYYPLYVALIGLSAYSLLGLFLSVDMRAFAERVDKRMPARFIAVVLAVTLLFTPIWLIMMAQSIRAQQPPETFLVFVFDLAFLLPACAYTAAQTWRRRPVGFLLAGMLLVKAALSGILLLGGELLKIQLGLAPSPEQMAMYLFLAVAGTTGLGFYLRRLEDAPRSTSRPVLTKA